MPTTMNSPKPVTVVYAIKRTDTPLPLWYTGADVLPWHKDTAHLFTDISSAADKTYLLREAGHACMLMQLEVGELR